MRVTSLAFAVLVLTAPASAQLGLAGTGLRIYANAFTRGGAGTGAGELMQRFDADDVVGFGVEPGAPGMHVVRGVAVQWRDFGSTPNGLCDITIYTEDPLRPGYPDLSTPLGGAVGVQPGGLAILFQFVQFPAPVMAPIGRDLFVGIKVNAASSAIGGVRLNALYGAVGAVTYDLAGGAMPASPPEANSYRLFRDLTTDVMTYQSRGQYMIDLLTRTPGGFATARTNQTNYTISNSAPGATTMLSGLHPDAASPPYNPGRADDVGFFYVDNDLDVGMPVVFVASFAGFGAVTPLDSYVPGSTGACCLGVGHFVTAIAALDSLHTASQVTTLPAAARAAIAGLSWAQQAIGFDTTAGVLRGSQCVAQRF